MDEIEKNRSINAASVVVGVIGFILIVIINLDIMGITNIFPFK